MKHLWSNLHWKLCLQGPCLLFSSDMPMTLERHVTRCIADMSRLMHGRKFHFHGQGWPWLASGQLIALLVMLVCEDPREQHVCASMHCRRCLSYLRLKRTQHENVGSDGSHKPLVQPSIVEHRQQISATSGQSAGYHRPELFKWSWSSQNVHERCMLSLDSTSQVQIAHSISATCSTDKVQRTSC